MAAVRCLCVLLIAVTGLSAGAGAAPPAQSRPGGHAVAAPQQQPAAPPAPEMRIAAVVNDEVISVFDLISRIRLVLISSAQPDTPEGRQRIASQILRLLIDEKLQLEEAKRKNVTATDDEINKALAQIEKQNNMQPGQLNEYLKQHGIDRGALVDQLTASIVWAKLVRRQAAQTTEITDEEIDSNLKRLNEHVSEPQSRVAEIFLAVDNPAQEEEVRQLAERLSAQMRQGARFSAIAQQFSQSATAAVGGDIGWVRPDQLSPELGKVVGQLRPGELSAPVRAGGGFYLLLVLDRRNSPAGSTEEEEEFDIVQVVFPVPGQAGDAARRAAIAAAEGVRTAAKDCPDMLRIGKEKAPQLSSEGHLRSSQISPQLRKVVSGLPVGQASEPIVQRNGVGVIMVCAKSNGAKKSAPTREEAAESLLRQHLDMLARRYMRDLRRSAYVDVRMASQ